jgi:hypothetical protein
VEGAFPGCDWPGCFSFCARQENGSVAAHPRNAELWSSCLRVRLCRAIVLLILLRFFC